MTGEKNKTPELSAQILVENSVSENCRKNSISLIAPTKTFNLAGLQTAAAVVSDEHLHHRLWRAVNTDEVGEPNAFAIQATIAAFRGTHMVRGSAGIHSGK